MASGPWTGDCDLDSIGANTKVLSNLRSGLSSKEVVCNCLHDESQSKLKWEWYFLMQHYGAPTRLLDWTGNPLVALYFAIVDQEVHGKNRDAAVWVFDPWEWNKLNCEGLHGPALPNWKEASPYLPDLEEACDGVQVEKRWPIALEPRKHRPTPCQPDSSIPSIRSGKRPSRRCEESRFRAPTSKTVPPSADHNSEQEIGDHST